MEDFIYKNKKKIIIVGVVALVVIIGISGYFIIKGILYSVTLNITIAPSIAKVRVGDKVFDSIGEYRIRPGEYEIEVFAEGFISKAGELKVETDEVVNFSEYLEPTEENGDWYTEHPEDGLVMGDIMSDMQMQEYYRLQEVEPILNYVPYNTFTYWINYEDDCKENGGGLCLILEGDIGVRDTMIQYLQANGDNLSRYKVKVKGNKSPFDDASLSIPDGLTYNRDESLDFSAEIQEVSSLVEEFIGAQLIDGGFSTEILQIKGVGRYCIITVKVYQKDSDGRTFDTYRMLIGKVGEHWRVLSNIDWLLTRYNNPKIPVDLLREANEF